MILRSVPAFKKESNWPPITQGEDIREEGWLLITIRERVLAASYKAGNR